MDYHFIEYRANEMIPGDWEWYLNSYCVEPKTGMRVWVKNGSLTIRVYEFPEELKQHVLTAAVYAPMNAKRYSNKTLPAPEGMRWGIVTCIRKDFADLLGPELFQNAVVGELKTWDGRIIRDWLPIVIKNRISYSDDGPSDPVAEAGHIVGRAIYASESYSMILPDDLFQVVRGFRFKGCKITRCAGPD